jgi:predicted helicase
LNASIYDGSFNRLKAAPPYYFLIPRSEIDQEEYQAGWSLKDSFPINTSGIVTARDAFVTAFDDSSMEKRIADYLNPGISDEKIKERYGLEENYAWRINDSRKELRRVKDWRHYIKNILYRPFDTRRIIYHPSVVWRTREEIMRHMVGGNNLALSTTRSIEIGRGWEHVFCSSQLIQHHTVSIKEVNYLFPLYLYDSTKSSLLNNQTANISKRRVNLAPQFITDFATRLGAKTVSDGRGDGIRTFGPEDIFHYIYTIFHSPTYRRRYTEYLKIDFPRIPLTSDAELFRNLCALGADLVALHLLEDDYEAASWNASKPKGKSPLKFFITRFAGKGGADVVKGHPKYEEGNVYINPSRYFEGVPEKVWNFHIGGYQVCEKWLKDRRERTLNDEDIKHYQRVVVALNETIRLMAEIDRTIEEHGGWPLAGSQEAAAPVGTDALPFA